jgi:hypothetical protein
VELRRRYHLIRGLVLPALLFGIGPARAQKPDWREYQNIRTGLMFRYPPEYTIRLLLDPGGGLVEAVLGKEGTRIVVTLKDLGDYPDEWRNEGRNTFASASAAIARLLCDAGGPDGERSCPEVLHQSTFSNANGLECVEMELREEIREHQPPKFTTRVLGPIYSVRLPRPGLPLILLFQFDREHVPSTADRDLLAGIVRTVGGANEPRPVAPGRP